SYPNSYGLAGWSKDDEAVFIYDRYDLWQVDPRNQIKPTRLTEGRPTQTRYRYLRLDRDEKVLPTLGPWWFETFDENNKHGGYARLDTWQPISPMRQVVLDSFAFDGLRVAEKAPIYFFTKENFKTFPDLWMTNDWIHFQRISDANPQQSKYRWGDISLYHWYSDDGEMLEGMLVKPEGFDPSRKYPMIVNFYEKSSDGLMQYRTLDPNRSQIVYPYYASKGYVIFNPNIPYKIGYPGESAFNAVMSGVTALMNEGFIDPDHIGVQGHSWGGYQIAHLITRTNLFACAESGAPVVNMFSAYGGIRWGSGMSREFQYEHTQSRIGGTIWDYPLRFIENSPLFFLDKIETPVLILHNDEDSAVPWYQGIEFFTGMRRLNKPAWLLNYNGEPHWPLKWQNRVDFQRRMAQFFDHYLQGGPLPLWMQQGVPAIDKGIRQGFEEAGDHDRND
ncbi:MAG: S9 family peptidase, partial [Saprospiraceae bacterium]|nr:S9 family peptidase [Saprospiraceae bacterium]